MKKIAFIFLIIFFINSYSLGLYTNKLLLACENFQKMEKGDSDPNLQLGAGVCGGFLDAVFQYNVYNVILNQPSKYIECFINNATKIKGEIFIDAVVNYLSKNNKNVPAFSPVVMVYMTLPPIVSCYKYFVPPSRSTQTIKNLQKIKRDLRM